MRPTPILSCLILAATPLCAAEKRPCLDLVTSHARVTLRGELTVRIFPLLPILSESSAAEPEEPALILLLPEEICANDGLLIEGTTSFQTVEVRTEKPRILSALNGAVGRTITVLGEATGAQGKRDKAPLVIYVDGLRPN